MFLLISILKFYLCQPLILNRKIFAFDEGERTLIEKCWSFYGSYDVVNLAPPENFSGANDVISMPCASVLLFGVISLDKIVLCNGLLSLLFGGFSSKVEEF